MAEGGSAVDRDPLRLADDLIAAFEKLRTRSDGITSRPKVAPLRLVMAYGLAAQAHDVGQDAVRAIRDGRYGAAPPLTRVVFECGVTAQWLVIEPEAATAMAAEAHRQRIALAGTMAKTQRFLRHAESVRVSAGPAPPPQSVSSKNFEKVCAQVDPAGDLYVMYRTLSADAHAGAPIIHRWIGESGDPPVLGWRPTPTDLLLSERTILGSTLALSLLWAAAGFDQMVKGRPLVRTVNTVSAKLGYAGTTGVHQLVLPPRR
ncbi:hypothetical protein JOF29_006060 [Kribbella aluminosa]|uniref:Uncharacterized protein n=1 Tax=Kribbella aluminosa TaxID=416017 RepID=A0ABS4UTH3_9ACTN|nr:DUF5677 domain-containing protein [Kribbella aluminosa]MBP2354950.1 hypothetical protein [Kribbella aluminosa]